MKRPRKKTSSQWGVKQRPPQNSQPSHPQHDSDWDSLTDSEENCTPSQSITSGDRKIFKWREATRPSSSAGVVAGAMATSPRSAAFAKRRVRGPRMRQDGTSSPMFRSHHFDPAVILENGEKGAIFLATMAIDVLKKLLVVLRTPIQWMLTLWILCFGISYFYAHWAGLIQKTVSPLCSIPLMSSKFAFCSEENIPLYKPKADYPSLMELQGNLESLLEKSVGGSTLAFDLKQSEMAVKDLKSLVTMSQLMCRERLAATLEDFVQSARFAGRDLQKLGSRVGGSVDGVLAVNDYALRAIEAANRAKKQTFLISALTPWHTPSHDEISDIFVTSMSVLEENMRSLITEAEVAVVGLDNLEVQLTTIHEMTSREKSLVGLKRETLLGDIWTMLGANKDKMKQYANHILLLENISTYRKRALAHVAATLVQLQQLSQDLQELRERVSRPALLADRTEIPLEVHILSIRKGIERLDAGRMRMKQLESDALHKMIAPPPVEIRM